MIIDKLTLEENSYSGFSHQAAVTFADLAALAAGASGTLNIGSILEAQDIILRAAIVVDTPFTFSDGTIISCTVSGGDTTNGATSLFTAQQIEAAETPIVAAVFALTLAFAATATLQLTFACTATKNLNTATAGQLRVLYSLTRLVKFNKF